MKTFFVVVVAFFLVSFMGCQEKNLVEPSDTPQSDGKIQIVTSLGKVVAENDTINIEKDKITIFQAVSESGLSFVSMEWTFSDGKTAHGSPAEYFCQLDPNSVVLVTVIGREQNGTPHSATCHAKVVYSLDGLPGFSWISSTPAAGGKFSIVIIVNKKAMAWHSGPVGYTGNITPDWHLFTAATVDTNYNGNIFTSPIHTNNGWVNGNLVAAEAGSVGKLVAIRITVAPGVYQIPVGRIVNGVLVWDTFWGDFLDNKIVVGTDGKVTPIGVSPSLPGTSGDKGDSAVIRFSLTDSSIVLYPNNGVPFSSYHPYIQLQDSSGTWQDIYLESSVIDFPNWGTFELPYKKFLIPGLLVLRFGKEINNPAGSVVDMSKSDYYDPVFKVLKIRIVVTSLPKIRK